MMISHITKQLCLCLGLLAASHIHAIHSIIERQENYDLCISASYRNDDNTVFNHIDHTFTRCGSNQLVKLLENPTNDIAELTRRQSLIKQLAEQPAVCQQIQEHLHTIAEHEDTLLALWQPEDATTKTALKEFFYENKFLAQHNSNPHAVNIGFIAHTANLFMPIAEHAVLHFLISDKLKNKLSIGCCPTHNHKHSHKHHDHGSIKHSHKHGSECKQENDGAQLLYKAYNTAHMAVHLIGIKALISHVYQKMLLAKDIQKKLIAVSKIITSIKNIEQVIESEQLAFLNTTHLNHLEHIDPISEKFCTLLQLLEKNDFKKVSILPNVGNILAAYNLIKEVQEEFGVILQTLAEVDTYISITTLYTSYQHTNTPYTFASYATSKQPHIKLSNYWNVLLTDATTGNSIEIGNNVPNHSIITGPNGSGKSTLLKSLAISIILGQTITLIPAEYGEFTPFHHIFTSMTHLDNMNNGQSLFIAEIVRANDIVKRLKELAHHQHALVLLDEVCKSTTFEKGQESARSLIQHLGSYPQVLSCSATHFPALASLENNSPELFRNYMLELEYNNETPLYRYRRGFSKAEDVFTIIQANGLNNLWN